MRGKSIYPIRVALWVGKNRYTVKGVTYIDIDRFVELVDDTSWAEFMPKGVTKPLFADFTKY